MFHDDLIGWTTMSRTQSIPYAIPFVQRYYTCPRFDHRYADTLFNLLPASLFTCSVTHHPVINSLITLCTLWWCPTEWAQRYLSVTRSDKSQSRFVPTQQTLSEISVVHLDSHPVTLWRLVHPKHSYGIREFHNLIVIGTCISHDESNINKTKRSLC